MSTEIIPPAFEYIDLDRINGKHVEEAVIQGYDLWHVPYGTPLSVDVARALRVMHIRDFTLRALMPDSSHKFTSLEESTRFTNDKIYNRDAYVLTAQKDEVVDSNLAAFGWFRPLIDPRNSDNYEDYDLASSLCARDENPGSYATAAIEVFAGYRQKLAAVDLIEASLADYSVRHPEVRGICVRVGTFRAINMVEHTQFERLSSEEGGGGIFVRRLR